MAVATVLQWIGRYSVSLGWPVLWLGIAAPSAAQDTTAGGPVLGLEPFRTLAAELVAGIDALEQRLQEPKTVTGRGGRLRIAILPPSPDEVPVSATLAGEYNDRLLAALMEFRRDRYDFAARDALKRVIAELTELGYADETPGGPVAALLRNARVDVLIVGKMRRPASGHVILSYKAVGVNDGAILASTRHRSVRIGSSVSLAAKPAMTLDQGLREATRHLADSAPDMRELRLGGVHFETRGIQTAFGQYVQDRMGDALQSELANLVTGTRLVVAPAAPAGDGPSLLREVGGDGEVAVAATVDGRAGVYLLTGRYWDFGDALELRLTLHDAKGVVATWRKPIRADSVPVSLGRRPAVDPDMLHEDAGLGPVGLHLTSPRGKDPVYRVGEALDLLVRTPTDASLYCFYQQSDGKILKIFPNPFQRDPSIVANRLYTIPGDLFPFDLTIREPGGMEVVKCFATARDASPGLPPALDDSDLRPLPVATSKELFGAFRDAGSGGISEASIVITVEGD